MTTGIINGTAMLLYVGGVAVGAATSHDVSQSVNMRDATTKDSGGNEEVLPGLSSSTIGFEGFTAFDETYGWDELNALIKAKTPVTLKFGTEIVDDPREVGTAYLESLDQTNPTEDNSGYSGTFHITGGLSTETVT